MLKIAKNYGDRLLEERKRLKYTQIEFARSCGAERSSQYLYEKEKRPFTIEYIEKLGELGVDLPYLLFNMRSVEFDIEAALKVLSEHGYQVTLEKTRK